MADHEPAEPGEGGERAPAHRRPPRPALAPDDHVLPPLRTDQAPAGGPMTTVEPPEPRHPQTLLPPVSPPGHETVKNEA
ncbi:hypothetical protein NL676_001040 [Syzygium grande]|nr:hypothetical protein NL676_001040 [Syzygium grande]